MGGWAEDLHPRVKGRFTNKADSEKVKKPSLARQMVALAGLAPKLGSWAKTMAKSQARAAAASAASKSSAKNPPSSKAPPKTDAKAGASKSLAKTVARYAAPKKDLDVGLKQGRHVESLGIRANTRQTLQQSIKNIINQAGLKGALAKHPLGKVEVKTGKVIVTKNGIEKESHSSGVYDASTRKIQVRQDRKEGSWGKDFKPGEVHSMSQCARTKDQAVARTLLHEIGHHLFHQDDKLYKAAQKAYDSHGPKTVTKKDGKEQTVFSTKPGFSSYAQKSASEYMSEALVAFMFHRKALKEYDPAAYKLASRMVQTRGLNAKPTSATPSPKAIKSLTPPKKPPKPVRRDSG